ncbi:MAG: hypothetical protein H6636_07780 [Anaerolineales bacterium]|nr:hypothetical protein [Anaerolineales bacterium]
MSRIHLRFLEILLGLAIVVIIIARTDNMQMALLTASLALPIIFASWISTSLLGSSEKKVKRHFQRKPNIRMEVIQEIVDEGKTSLDELSPLEIVAVFSILLAKIPLDEVIQKMRVFSDENGSKQFDEAFFQNLENTLQAFRIKRFSEERYLLLQFAENVATHHHYSDWADKFHHEFMQIAKKQVETQPVFHARVK